MEAGLLFQSGGPVILAILGLGYIFVSHRRPLAAPVWFGGLMGLLPFLTYRLELQGALTALAVGVLASAAFVRLLPRPGWPRHPADRVVVGLMALFMVASGVGLLAGNNQRHLAADALHLFVVFGLLYASVRGLVGSRGVGRVLDGYVAVAAVLAALTVQVLATTGPEGHLVWLVGAPLDEGGVRIKASFAFPLLALLVAATRLLTRPRLPMVVAGILLAAAMVLTYKRTFWIASMVGLLPVLVAVLTSGTRPVVLARRVAGLLAVVGAGTLLAILVGLNTESFVTRTRDLAAPTEVATYQSRQSEWREVLHHIGDRPLGHGLGAALRIPHHDPDGRLTHYIHSTYLQWTVLAGAPATALLVAMLGGLGVGLWRRRHDPDALALGGALVALAVAGLALQSFQAPMATVFLALAASRTEGPRTGPPG